MKKTIKQFNRYAIVGIFSTLINYLIYYLIYNLSNLIVLSSAIGYIAGLTNSYFFAKIWVFPQKESNYKKTILRFILVYLLGGLLSSITIFLLDNLNFQYALSWFLGNGMAVMNNFIGSRLFVFNKK